MKQGSNKRHIQPFTNFLVYLYYTTFALATLGHPEARLQALPYTPESTEVIIEPDHCVEYNTEKEWLVASTSPKNWLKKGVIAVVDHELLSIPLESFLADKALWPEDKDAEIVIYCGSGHRSTMAMAILLS